MAMNWLGSPKIAIYAILGTIVWKELGFGIMLFRARLSSLEPSLFDAARVDGANAIQLLIYIVIPQLYGIIEFFVIYYIIAIFSAVFGYVFVITYGGPAKSTTVLDFEIYQYAFLRNSRGEASALAFMVLLGALIFIYLEYRLRKRLEYEVE
jgi:ABC-type sugar transport system permease subunit